MWPTGWLRMRSVSERVRRAPATRTRVDRADGAEAPATPDPVTVATVGDRCRDSASQAVSKR
jgi:hypothetical protein